tara:strand:- start:2600 stop:4690 length:2091 start_codon:yes stop_codon:yes gene_type:complete
VRIQGISQTGVPGAEQISLGAISSAAQAKMKTTQALTKVVGDYEAKVQKAEQEAEMHSATIGLEKDTQALMQSIESSNAYDDDGRPTYKGMPDQFQKGMSELIDKHRKNLSFPSSKVAYNQSVEKYNLDMTGKLNGIYRTRQTEHLKGELTKNLDHYGLDLESGLSRARADIDSNVAGLVITPSQGQDQYDSFRAQWQSAKVSSDFGVERASGDGQAYLDSFMTSPPPEMPVDEQLSLQSRMNTLLKQDATNARIEAKAIAAIETERQKSLEKTGTSMANQLKEGQLVTDAFIVEYTNIGNQITDPDIQKSMAQALSWSADLRDAITSNSMAELNSIKQDAIGIPANTLEESERNEFIASSIDRVMNLVEKDPQLAAVQMGIVKPQINTLQSAIDNNDLETFFGEMVVRKNRIDDLWGIDSNLFYESDTNLLSQMINKKDSIFLGEVINSLGEQSYDVLENLLGKASNDKVILGTLMAQADGAEAVGHVTNGMKLGSSVPMPSTADMSDLFQDRFTESGLYPQGDANYRMGVMANVRYAYASLSVDEGDFSKDLNEDRMTAAMDLVMQKPIEMKGDSRNMFSEDYYTFPARRSMTEKDMNAWKLSLPVSTFDSITGITEQSIFVYDEFENGRAAGYSDLSQATGKNQIQDSSSYIKSLIDSNTIQIRSFGEQGRYFLMWNNQTLKVGNENFVLEYK